MSIIFKRTITSILILITTQTIFAQYNAGETYYGTNEYIEYHAGDLPIIISAPHGGYLTPESIPDRDCSTCVTTRDQYTEELAYLIRLAIKNVFGKDPHIIINKLARTKLDANREIIEAAQGNLEAETAWYEFHEYIQTSKDSCIAQYGSALYIDLHAHGHDIQRIELGYLLSKAELQNSDQYLDENNFQDSSSIKHLKNELHPNIEFSEILRGNECMGEILHDHGYPSTPSASDPSPAIEDPYFSGGYNTQRHGSRDSSDINGIQFELNWTDIRNTDTNRKAFANSLACVVRSYVNKWFLNLNNWDPGTIVTNTNDKGPGSLRSILLGANDGTIITFDEILIGDTIRLKSPINICSDIVLEGPGADLLAISGGDSVRIFQTVAHDSISITGLSLVRGKSPINEDGGAIYADGSISLNNCVIAHNYAEDDGGAISINKEDKTLNIDSCIISNNSCLDDGGAIRIIDARLNLNASSITNNFSPSNGGAISTNGIVNIASSTFSYNAATNMGGAIRNFGNGIINSSNSTFSNNSTDYRGGAISNVGNINFNHCSIAYNTAQNLGGGIRNYDSGECSFKNTLISNNVGLHEPNISQHSALSISEGYNFVSDTTGSQWIEMFGDQLGNSAESLDAKINTLTYNGGNTETIAPQNGSPIIDKGNPITDLILDQRGENRSFCTQPDIGAHELQLDHLTWLGNQNAEWENIENWSRNYIPNQCTHVTIKGILEAPNQPIISLPNANCKNIILDSNAVLKVLVNGNLVTHE